jgi:5-methylcytosine-specific restriction endonuclease McrA
MPPPPVDWSGFAVPKRANRLSAAQYRKFKRWVHEVDSWLCTVCRMCNDPAGLQIHHAKSRGAGGGDTLDNCFTVCFSCHRKIEDHEIKVDWKKINGRRPI